ERGGEKQLEQRKHALGFAPHARCCKGRAGATKTNRMIHREAGSTWQRRVLGSLILIALAAHVVVKFQTGLVSELLWSCHVASAALGLGLVTGNWRLAAPGFLYHLALGMEAYLIDIAAGASTNATGVATHVASLFLGGVAAWGQPMPRRVVAEVWVA